MALNASAGEQSKASLWDKPRSEPKEVTCARYRHSFGAKPRLQVNSFVKYFGFRDFITTQAMILVNEQDVAYRKSG
jgi:hypothetical protein